MQRIKLDGLLRGKKRKKSFLFFFLTNNVQELAWPQSGLTKADTKSIEEGLSHVSSLGFNSGYTVPILQRVCVTFPSWEESFLVSFPVPVIKHPDMSSEGEQGLLLARGSSRSPSQQDWKQQELEAASTRHPVDASYWSAHCLHLPQSRTPCQGNIPTHSKTHLCQLTQPR